jgi:hypothetical protein
MDSNLMDKIFYLDWTKHELYGWEAKKSGSAVDAIIRGIERGDDFPPVTVHEGEKNKFYISPLREASNGYVDGGHHRALGHYELRKPLKCELIEGGPIWPDEMCIPISDIIIVDDRGQ